MVDPMKAPLLALVLLARLAAADTTIIKAARVFDGTGMRNGVAVLVDGGKITAIGAPAELAKQAASAKVLDLGDVTLLPGLIDAHTHIMMNGDADYTSRLVKQSIAARAIRATARAREVLLSG